MNEIPGSGVLGYGFDVLGGYQTSSVTQKIFTHKTMNAGSYTYPPTGIIYQVPDNISVIADSGSQGQVAYFATRQQFQNYYAAKAGLKGSYGAFSGEFNIAYSNTFSTDVSYTYGLYEADFKAWQLALEAQ